MSRSFTSSANLCGKSKTYLLEYEERVVSSFWLDHMLESIYIYVKDILSQDNFSVIIAAILFRLLQSATPLILTVRIVHENTDNIQYI